MPYSIKKFRETFEPELLKELEKNTKRITLNPGESIINMGQMIRMIPIVIEGSLKVSRGDDTGRELLLYYMNPGDGCPIAFTCGLSQSPSEISVVAANTTTLLAIPVSAMLQLISRFPTWENYVMSTINRRFRELLRTIDHFAFQKLDERIVYYLKETAKITGSSLVNVSHQHIADELATSRVVISRLLKKMEKEGKLLLYRNQIKLLSEL